MNDLMEKFLALEPRQKLGIICGAPMLILVLYYVFLIGPRMAETTRVEIRIAQMLEDQARKQAQTANIEARETAVQAVEIELQQAMARLPDEKEIPDLLSSISLLGRDSGLDILVFRQRPESYREFYAEVPVEMEVRGTYHQVSAFLDRVGRLDRIVNVSDMAVTDPEIQNGDLILRARSRVTTFRFLSEEERVRLRKEGKIGAEKADGQ